MPFIVMEIQPPEPEAILAANRANKLFAQFFVQNVDEIFHRRVERQ
jgi:hypothetical protein